MGFEDERSLIAGNQAVHRWVYNQIVALVDDCMFKSMTESPSHISSPEEYEKPSASLYAP